MKNLLIAKEGYIYTNGETFGYIIRLGKHDSVLNWWEITEEEYQSILDSQEFDN